MKMLQYSHRTNLFSVFVVMLFMYSLNTIKAGAQNKILNKHVIISLDNALHPKYETVLCEQNRIQQAIAKIATDLDLKEGDYYSFVNVGINEYAENISQLARPIKDAKGKFIVWREFKSVKDMFAQGKSWYDMVLTQGINEISYMGRQFSLLTGAKAYSLSCIPKQGEEKMANKTYLVMITDDQYNGNNDQNTEFNMMYNTRMNKQEFLAHCRNVAKYYNFQFCYSVLINDTLEAKYEAFLYEVIPSSSYALGAVVNYPANLGLRRVKGGYRLQFPLETISNEFLIRCFGLHIITNQGGKRVRNTYYFYPKDKEVSVLVPTDDVMSDRLEVEIEGWIHQNDSIYGGVLLNPYDPLFSRLHTCQVLTLTNEAKIYGLLPIPDGLWLFTNNCQTAVLTWDIICLLVLIAVICFIAYLIFNRITAYKPNNNIIRLRKY